MKLHEPIFPPETGHVRVVGGSKRSVGPAVVTNETDVSSGFHPDPATVTVVPVGPRLGVKMTIGPPVTMNDAIAEGNAPPKSEYVMKYDPEGTAPTVKKPATLPFES